MDNESKYMWQKLISKLSQSSGGSQLKSFSVELTRPANTTPYTAGDLVGDVSTIFKTFAGVAKQIGKR